MAQAYYTLDEAAQRLAMSTDELKQMARKGQIRSFQDRGTWRFRVQDIQELARQRGMGTEPDMVLGEALAPPPPEPPAPRSPVSKGREEPFDFSLDLDEDHVGVGHEDLGAPPAGSRRGESKKSGPRSPAPKPGSDSDVRLVPDSAMPANAQGSTSEMKVVLDAPSGRSSKLGPRAKTGTPPPAPSGPRSSKMEAPRSSKMEAPPRSGKMEAPRSSKIDLTQRPSKLGSPRRTGMPAADPMDSGVRLVPLESDSDVKIVGADSADVPIGQQPPKSSADSDIRVQPAQGNPLTSSDEGMLTEEINLDEELQKGVAPQPRSKVQPKPSPGPEFPTASPFELSEADINLPEPAHDVAAGGSDFELATNDSSSDFDLTPAGQSSSPIETGSSDEFNLELPDDADVALGELPPSDDLKGPGSGIRLENPVDSGISLEQGGSGSDEIEFELSLDGPEATPRPAGAVDQVDSDSEFELSLDVDSEAGAGLHGDSSEFELTLDDSGGLAPLEDSSGSSEDKDIFETDFEVPALEEESGSQAVALDESAEGEVESSDFDLTLGGDEEGAVDESGSQVVALEEGEDFGGGMGEAEGFGEFDAEAEAEAEEEEEEPAVYEKALPTAPWGALPVVFMLPCVIVLFVVGIMGFELVQSMVGHKPPGMVTRAIGGMLGQNLKQ